MQQVVLCVDGDFVGLDGGDVTAEACLHGHFDVAHSTFQLEAAAHAGHETGAH